MRTFPALTTIHQDAALRARTAIRRLEALRDGTPCDAGILIAQFLLTAGGFPAQVLQCPLLADDLAGLFKDVVKLLHDFVLLSYHANRRLHTCCISSFAFIGAMSTETAAFFGSTVSVARMGANGLLLLW